MEICVHFARFLSARARVPGMARRGNESIVAREDELRLINRAEVG
jgi:hypothetical protein